MELNTTEINQGFRSYDQWLRSLNRTRATGHRWRKVYPWLKITNIFGKNYIHIDVISEFERRARDGELASIRISPALISKQAVTAEAK